MPLKPHPTNPDKMLYVNRYYDIPELQGVTTTPSCLCGEPWRLNIVHREKSPCFDFIEHPWVDLTAEEVVEFEGWMDDEEEKKGWASPAKIVAYISNKLRSKNT